jgi:hypothetical protein
MIRASLRGKCQMAEILLRGNNHERAGHEEVQGGDFWKFLPGLLPA